MEFWKSWQFWLQILSLLGTGLLMAFNWFSHNKIVGNDLHHLSVNVKQISNTQIEQGQKIGKLSEDISYIKGRQEVIQKAYSKRKKI